MAETTAATAVAAAVAAASEAEAEAAERTPYVAPQWVVDGDLAAGLSSLSAALSVPAGCLGGAEPSGWSASLPRRVHSPHATRLMLGCGCDTIHEVPAQG